MIRELTVDGDRVLARTLIVVAVENPSVGDWAAYVADNDTYEREHEADERAEEFAARQGDKLSESEAARYFRGPQCPQGPYRD